MISSWHEDRSGSSKPIRIVRFDVADLLNYGAPEWTKFKMAGEVKMATNVENR